MNCRLCQHENRPSAKFCEECAAPLTRSCSHCGGPLSETAKYCPECAQPVSEAASSTGRFGSPDNYTPKHLAERIFLSKDALEGERKQVTVLFADLKGSMELLAHRDPEEARRLLDPVLEHMIEAVHRYEGTVNQVMGDGIMALFGAPLALEDHAVRACYAALRMQESVKRYAAEMLRTHGLALHIRVGINSGEVVVRSISSDLRMDYTAVGQTAHLAARMEQLADPGSTLITGETVRLTEGFVHVGARGPVPVKGLGEPVAVFELTGAGSARTRLQAAAARGLTRFVGRNAELAQMFGALERAQAGQGQIIALMGEPGVGKSRLLWELTRSHRVQGCLVLESGSVSYGRAGAYRPLIDLLKAYFQIDDRDNARRIREKATGKLLTLDEQLRPLLVPLLALLDVAADDEGYRALDPVQKRLRTLDACKRLLLREAQRQPLVVVFEDLHWIDNESQAFLDTLVESLSSARLLLLVSFRPEHVPRWGGKSYCTPLRIDPLAGESADELLRTLLGAEPSVQPLARVLIDRTQGNPLYLEESVRTLVETGALLGERGAYRLVAPLTSIQVPATVQAILAARIDRLPSDDKYLLQAAAVIGKDVPHTLLQAITERPEEVLRQHLAALQSGDFLYEKSLFPDLEYTFKHALTHEVTYGGVLQERRKGLHARIVESIERLYHDRLAEQVERLAHHALRGELWDRALLYSRQAAEKAIDRSADRQAGALLEQAIGVLAHLPRTRDTLEQAVDLRLAARPCLAPLGEYAKWLELSREAEPMAQELNDSRREVLVHCAMTSALSVMGRCAEAIVHGEHALAIAESLQEPTLRIVARYSLGLSYTLIGDFRAAVRYYQREVGLDAEQIGEWLLGSWGAGAFTEAFTRINYSITQSISAVCFAELGAFDQALLLAERGARFAQALNILYVRAIADAALGFVHLRKGDAQTALQSARRWLQVYPAADLPFPRLVMAATLGEVFNVTGQLDEGIALLDEAWRFAESRDLLAWGQPVLALLGNAYGRAGRSEQAMAAGQRALHLARQLGQPGWEAWTLYLLGDIHCHGAPASTSQPRECYEQALLLAREQAMRPLEAQCHLALGEVAIEAGDKRTASEQLTTASSMFRDMDMRSRVEKTESALERI